MCKGIEGLIKKGEEIGKSELLKEHVANMISNGASDEIIIKYLGITSEKLAVIKAEMESVTETSQV